MSNYYKVDKKYLTDEDVITLMEGLGETTFIRMKEIEDKRKEIGEFDRVQNIRRLNKEFETFMNETLGKNKWN